jgi:hypothetical protein
MLSVAYQKRIPGEDNPVFIQQDITKLDLYGTADAAICCLDSINYITQPSALKRCFERLSLFINPGGIFLLTSIQKASFQYIRRCFVDETDGGYCCWRCFYSEKKRKAVFQMDIFTESGGVWIRSQEEHIQRAYGLSELTEMLISSGFEKVKVFGDRKLRSPGDDEDRVFITAVRKGK